MSYPGGKAGSGVYQRLISQIPPHRVYIEPFLGGGAVMRRKRPARWSIGIDVDPDVISVASALRDRGKWFLAGDKARVATTGGEVLRPARVDFGKGDGIADLRARRRDLEADVFVYCDPPYLVRSRRRQRQVYRHELSEIQHRELLRCLLELRCMVMVSGYSDPMYEEHLASWRQIEYSAQTRGGRSAVEVAWMNYPVPERLHDYRYLGEGYRERERLRRQQRRWRTRLAMMPVLERRALVDYLVRREGG